MGGATSYVVDEADGVGGLSPRGRGNQVILRSLSKYSRSIPAWAGQPQRRRTPFHSGPVYPRVGGATTAKFRTRSSSSGLSPRGRGNQLRHAGIKPHSGSIPAWAGQPLPGAALSGADGVYPRVGGATATLPYHSWYCWGLSPRGRGNRRLASASAIPARSIPAWAGQPEKYGLKDVTIQVYPRVGGATFVEYSDGLVYRGLSPRGRGNRDVQLHAGVRRGSIPAWAGQPLSALRSDHEVQVYPRVGGATLAMFPATGFVMGLSPRGRGNPYLPVLYLLRSGSIPAWAGQPVSTTASGTFDTVYPRVGGATIIRLIRPQCGHGLSPRGRGNPRQAYLRYFKQRSIPAWAGQP